jgi:hypothetical protein
VTGFGISHVDPSGIATTKLADSFNFE